MSRFIGERPMAPVQTVVPTYPPVTAPTVSPSALDLVRWAARHGVASSEDLATRFAVPAATVDRMLAGSVRAGLVRVAGVLAGEPELWVSTALGLRAVGLPDLRLCPAAPRAEGHLRAVAATAVWLEVRFGSTHDVLSERELEQFARARGRVAYGPRVSPYVNHGRGAYKRPDLLVVPRIAAGGLPVAVEVELTRKSQQWLEAICLAWRHCADVAAVVYLASPEVLAPLSLAVERTGAQERVLVTALADCDVPRLRRRVLHRPPPGPRTSAIGECADAVGDTELVAAVEWVSRWGIVCVVTLAARLGVAVEEACELVDRACRQRLLVRQRILRAESDLCWATRRGLRFAGLGHLAVCSINYQSALDGVDRARVAVELERESADRRLVGRRELAACQKAPQPQLTELAALAPNPAPGLALGRHRTAAALLTGDGRGDPFAVLIEAASPRGRVLADVLGAWLAVDGLGGVVLYAADPSVRNAAGRVAADVNVGASRSHRRLVVRVLPGPSSDASNG